MQVKLSLILAASMLTACGGGSSGGDSSAGTTAGDTTAGDTTAGSTDTGDTGSNTGGSVGGGTVSQLGFVDVEQFVFGSTVSNIDLSAGFITSSSLINVDTVTNSLKPTSDTCTFRENVSFLDDTDVELPGINISDIRTISAGETITFTSSAGTYATLNRETEVGFTGYSLELDGSSMVPTDLVVDIPGDEYPAFSNVAMPSVEPLTGINVSTGDVVNAGSTITWDGSPNSGSTISISAYSDFDITNFLTSTITEVDCFVIDDGSFTFPAAIQAQMGSISLANYDVGRDNVSVVRNGNVVLFLSAYSGN